MRTNSDRRFGKYGPFCAFLFLCLISGGAFAAPFKYSWSAEKIAALPGSQVNLRDKDQNVIDTLPIDIVRQLVDVKQKITAEAGIAGDLFVVDGDSPNAFAVRLNDRNVIGFNTAMLKQFGRDQHAIAAVMGHEIAHLVKDHGSAQQSADAVIGIIGLIAGLAVDRNLSRRYGASDIGINLASVGTTLASRAFSRDHEREADDVGVRYMRAAGFDPQGAVRLWRDMPSRNFSFFSTHPPSSERIGNIQTTIASLPAWAGASAKPVDVVSAATKIAEYREETSPPDDPFILALAAFRAGKLEEARQLSQKSADAGDPRGQVSMALFHLQGRGGVAKDESKAKEYLELAERQGSAMAMTGLGIVYERGLGIAQDSVRAADYYRRSADGAFPEGMARLASMKLRGLGIEKDIPGALDLATKASAESNNLGTYILGQMHFSGMGVARDLTKAREYFEKSAARGYASSDTMLGLIYLNGSGAPQNFDLAASYLRRAAAKNDLPAKANLAFMHLAGRGLPKDNVLAKILFDEAFKGGNALAALGLGHIYRGGISGQADPVLAFAYYDIATKKGLVAASKFRDELAGKLNTQEIESARIRAEALLRPSQ